MGWYQFGPTAELPRSVRDGLTALPDWRITCFFVDRERRHRGVARAALQGALEQVALLGGGVLEGYPEDVEGRKASGPFLWGGSLPMFQQAGFSRERRIGKHAWVVRRTVEAGLQFRGASAAIVVVKERGA